MKKISKRSNVISKYKCPVCDYIYDSDEGDPENNIPPGTPFENLPDDWTCPICGASKDEFEPLLE
ncbi:MAG: Flavorubredoxin [Thermodesulfobacteria bacterium]|nr:Flavorubredoxin [Thermodesulfobacteriota bacterium]